VLIPELPTDEFDELVLLVFILLPLESQLEAAIETEVVDLPAVDTVETDE
jgi:hypothetical protein